MNVWPRSHFCAQGSTLHRVCLSLVVQERQKRHGKVAGGETLETFADDPTSQSVLTYLVLFMQSDSSLHAFIAVGRRTQGKPNRCLSS